MAFSEYEDCLQWSCDRCRMSVEFPPGSFWDGLAEIKSRGWRVERGRHGWCHTCGNCRQNEVSVLDKPIGSKLRRVK